MAHQDTTMRDHAKRLAASRRFLLEEDVEVIQQAVAMLADRNPLLVADLGAGSGTTALSVFDVREDAQVVTVDIDADALHWAEAAVRNAYPDALWWGYQRSADNPVTSVRPFDLLLHDAGHTREDVDGDLRAWLPHLAPGALIWVHDYLPPPVDWGQPDSPGVRQAIRALEIGGLIEGISVGGLGWLGRPSC